MFGESFGWSGLAAGRQPFKPARGMPRKRPALTLVVRLAGIRIQVEASSLPPIRLRCPATVDLPDGAALQIAATLDLSNLDDVLIGSELFPLPIGTTEITVTEASHPEVVDAVVDALLASWSLSCQLQ